VFEKAAETTQFRQYREVGFRRNMLGAYTFSGERGNGKTTNRQVLKNTRVFLLGYSETNLTRPLFLAYLQHKSPIFNCMGGFMAN
jgi:hypothetical protein